MLQPDPSARSHSRAKLYPLDQAILSISPSGDVLRLRDILRSIAIPGSSGSGKTTIIDIVLKACLEAGHNALILTAKPDTAQEMLDIAERAGRKSDTVVVDPTGNHRFNPIDFALKNAGHALSIDEALDEIFTMVEILNRGDVMRQGDAFFEPAMKQCIRHVMMILWLAYEKIELRKFLAAVQTLPNGYEALDNPGKCEILGHLEEARKRFKEGEHVELDLAEDYIKKEIVGLSDRTRSSIQISATVKVAGLFQRPIYPMCFAGETNVDLNELFYGHRVFIIDAPLSRYRTTGRAIGAAFKQATQKAALDRGAKHQRPKDSMVPVGIWCDESQGWLTDYDSEACERGRSSRLYHVYSFQSIGSLVRGFGGGEQGISRTEDLLANLNIRIMGGQTDARTREALSRSVGAVRTAIVTRGVNVSAPVRGQGGGSRGASESVVEQDRPMLPEQAFLGLKDGEAGIVEAFIFIAGRLFKHNQKRYLKVRFLADHFKGNNWCAWYPRAPVSIFLDQTPTARSWAYHVPFWKLVWRCIRRPRLANKLIDRWLAFWLRDDEELPNGKRRDIWEDTHA